MMIEAAENMKKAIGHEKWLRLKQRLCELNNDILSRGIKPYKNQADLLTGYSYGEFYDWDLFFENIYMSYYGVSRYCRANLEVFLDNQLACGFVSRTLINPRWRQHFKPFLAQVGLLGSRQTGQFAWLAGKYYEKLKKYLDYWFWFSDFDKNGLCVWDSADHSGMDNQVSRAGAMDSMTSEGVDLNCYLVRELLSMAEIAQELNEQNDVAHYKEQAKKLITLINDTFWHENDGFYYDRNERSGELIRVKSIAGFIPLWLGIVPQDRAKRMIHEHLTNPHEFWLSYPVCCYAKTESDYYQQKITGECNWCGTTWIPTNYMLFHGLMKQGYKELAGELAYRTFDLVISEETTREYYDSETGIGQGLNPFWGWSSLGYFMPLEFELEYDPTEITEKQIKPIAREALDLALSHSK